MIRVERLTKRFRVHKRPPGIVPAIASLFRRTYEVATAVDQISFQIAPGERVGFLGPNGAGKTTTLKMLAGLLHPTEGEIEVDGHVPRKREDAFLKKIMLVTGQKQQLIWDLPPAETFELNRAVYGVPRERFDKTLAELTELLAIGDLVGKPTRQLSLGERMKCELAAALVHGPKVLFLDEPTIGLDVSMQTTIRAFIRRYNEQEGATLMLTSHYMDDVAALCPRVIVIDRGRLFFDGALDELSTRIRPERRVRLRLSKPVGEADLAALGKVIERGELEAEIQVPQGEVSETLTRALATLPVSDITVTGVPLEEVMREVFERSRAEREAASEGAT